MAGPLDGLKVVEMAGLGPCPLAGQLLCDLGADVIVIDRQSGKVDPTDINRRGKRSVALNLKKPEGVETAKAIIKQMDILLEGFRPGIMEKLGLGPDACHTMNQGLVYGRMTGWGQNGPWSQSAGHDINYLALSGALHAIGRKNEPPIPPLNLAADYGGGTMFLLFGVLSALFERSKSGKGQVVDAAMIDGVPAMLGLYHMFLARGELSNQREDNMLDGGAPFYRAYETKDGKYLAVGALEPQFFKELIKGMGLEAESDKAQYDKAHWPDARTRYEALFKTRTRDEWMSVFEGTDACVAPVLTFEEAPHHPQNAARKNHLEIDGVIQSAPAPRFDRTPPAMPHPARAPGADARAVLEEAGFTNEAIDELYAKGVLT